MPGGVGAAEEDAGVAETEEAGGATETEDLADEGDEVFDGLADFAGVGEAEGEF